MNTNKADITAELLLVYELSLSVGKTLNVTATCRDFLRILVARRNLSGASIWWLEQEAPDKPATELVLLDAIPRSEIRKERLPLSHPLWQSIRGKSARSFAVGEVQFASPVGHDAESGGACALFPLSDSGVLVMNSPTTTTFTPRVLGQLRAVVAKLATAIQGSMAFSRLQQSELELRKTNQRLSEARQTSEKYALQLEREHAHLQTLIHTLPDLVWLKDSEGVYLSCNRRFEDFFGASGTDIVGKTDYDFVDKDLAYFFRAHDKIAMTKGSPSVNEEWITFANDGHKELLETTRTPMFDLNGQLIGVLGIGHDITERIQMEERIRQLAFHDALTKLPNRRLLNDRLSQAMAASKRSDCYGALMFLDMDNYKPLNDLHGHKVGDLLLIEAAKRLKACVREIDTVARFGGDEFVVMIRDLTPNRAESAAQAGLIAEKIRTALSERYSLTIKSDEKKAVTIEHRCTASIGVVLFFKDEASQDDILKWADAAMYQAKEAGRNLIRFYGDTA
jgi:diguanylate cyclase (GGDEF)-like protein/PAS domain S-box-containing protein